MNDGREESWLRQQPIAGKAPFEAKDTNEKGRQQNFTVWIHWMPGVDKVKIRQTHKVTIGMAQKGPEHRPRPKRRVRRVGSKKGGICKLESSNKEH